MRYSNTYRFWGVGQTNKSIMADTPTDATASATQQMPVGLGPTAIKASAATPGAEAPVAVLSTQAPQPSPVPVGIQKPLFQPIKAVLDAIAPKQAPISVLSTKAPTAPGVRIFTKSPEQHPAMPEMAPAPPPPAPVVPQMEALPPAGPPPVPGFPPIIPSGEIRVTDREYGGGTQYLPFPQAVQAQGKAYIEDPISAVPIKACPQGTDVAGGGIFSERPWLYGGIFRQDYALPGYMAREPNAGWWLSEGVDPRTGEHQWTTLLQGLGGLGGRRYEARTWAECQRLGQEAAKRAPRAVCVGSPGSAAARECRARGDRWAQQYGNRVAMSCWMRQLQTSVKGLGASDMFMRYGWGTWSGLPGGITYHALRTIEGLGQAILSTTERFMGGRPHPMRITGNRTFYGMQGLGIAGGSSAFWGVMGVILLGSVGYLGYRAMKKPKRRRNRRRRRTR